MFSRESRRPLGRPIAPRHFGSTWPNSLSDSTHTRDSTIRVPPPAGTTTTSELSTGRGQPEGSVKPAVCRCRLHGRVNCQLLQDVSQPRWRPPLTKGSEIAGSSTPLGARTGFCRRRPMGKLFSNSIMPFSAPTSLRWAAPRTSSELEPDIERPHNLRGSIRLGTIRRPRTGR